RTSSPPRSGRPRRMRRRFCRSCSSRLPAAPSPVSTDWSVPEPAPSRSIRKRMPALSDTSERWAKACWPLPPSWPPRRALPPWMPLQRFILSEIGDQYKIKSLQNINISTVVTLITCAALAFLADPSNPGAGGMILWPLFGTTNQLTAGLSLLVLTLILWRWGRNFLVSLIPLIFIVAMTMSSMVLSIIDFTRQGNTLLVVIGTIILALNAWLILEGLLAVNRQRQENRLST